MNESTYVLTTLAKNPDYYDDVIKLIEKAFSYSSENSFANDFALLIHPQNFDNCYLFVDPKENKVISHIAVCPRKMAKKNFCIDIGFIGGIATDKDYRGKGLFRALMNHAIEDHQKEIGLFILWSEITGLYEKFNFYLSGGFIETGKSFFSHNDRPAGFQKTKFTELNSNEFSDIVRIYNDFNSKYFFTTLREEKDWDVIKSIISIDLYVRKNEEGQIIQYFCINKGRDLNNIIHEIGALPEHYLPLMKQLGKFKTWLPESEKSLFPEAEIFFNAYFRIGNFERFKDFINKNGNEELVVDKITDKQIEFHYGEKVFTATHQEFLQYIFGPRPLQEFEKFLLSPYIPGTDSV